MNRLILFLLICNGVCKASNKYSPILLEGDNTEYTIGTNNFYVFEDSTNSLELDHILKDNIQNKFQLCSDGPIPAYNDHYGSTYWVKFTVKSKAPIDRWYILESYAPHTEYLDFYTPSDGEYILKKSGLNQFFYNRDYVNKNLVFDLPIRKGETKTFYLKIHSPKYWSGFDFHIKSIKEWTEYSTTEYFFLGLFYGILIIMALYNLFLYLILKERVHVQFVIYIFFGLLVTAIENGLGHQFIWYYSQPLFSFLGLYIFPLGLTISFLVYAKTFLELNKRNEKFSKLVNHVAIGFVGYHVLHHVLNIIGFGIPYFRYINTIPYLVILYISIISYKNHFRPAKYFIIGSAVIALSMLTNQLRANNIIGGNLFTVYLFNYGLVIDILFFSLALSERIKFIKQNEQIAQRKIIEQLEENEQLRTKVNRELEEKVKEKTSELAEQMILLNESNEKLSFAIEELKRMNVTLDLDNWKLKKTLKKSNELRLDGKELSFEGFCELYPDKLACLKKISQLKWGDSEYKCKKCQNLNYSKGPQPYSRKCTKCNYTETATAFTLYHGVRFPLNKAIYITYLIVRNEKRTIEQLSAETDMRMNTCWGFKKKIVARKDIVLKKHKKERIESWEILVVD